jgi:hypothetical protein
VPLGSNNSGEAEPICSSADTTAYYFITYTSALRGRIAFPTVVANPIVRAKQSGRRD